LDSGETTTFSHIVYFAPLREGYIQMAFGPGTLERNPEITKVGIFATLRGYNFMLRLPIGMRSEARL
jgi:hypothetical protein